MNLPLLAAGALSLMAASIHGVVGDRIVRRIDAGALPSNPFDGISTMLLIRVSWHLVTIAFVVLGVALVVVGIEPEIEGAKGIAYVAGAAFVSWSIFAFIAGLKNGGVGIVKSHPAPLIFLLTVGLILWGASQLAKY